MTRGMAPSHWFAVRAPIIHRARLSSHRFRANEVRLLLGVIAYTFASLLLAQKAPITYVAA